MSDKIIDLSKRSEIIEFTRGVLDRIRERCGEPTYTNNQPTWIKQGRDWIIEINGNTARCHERLVTLTESLQVEGIGTMGWEVFINEQPTEIFPNLECAKETAEGYLLGLSRGYFEKEVD